MAFTLCAAVIDVEPSRIPNWLTVPFCLAGMAFNLIWHGWAGLQASVLGFAAGFAIMFVLLLIGGGGAGDLKLMAALAAWLGPKPIVAVFLLSSPGGHADLCCQAGGTPGQPAWQHRRASAVHSKRIGVTYACRLLVERGWCWPGC